MGGDNHWVLVAGRFLVTVIGAAEAVYFGFVAVYDAAYGNWLFAGAFGGLAVAAFVGGLATIRKRSWGGLLIGLVSGVAAAFFAIAYSIAWALPWIVALILSARYALVSRRAQSATGR